jgi:hypothetical protein
MEYLGITKYGYPTSFNFVYLTYALSCHANQLLNCRVVKQLELYVCVGIPIPLNFG